MQLQTTAIVRDRGQLTIPGSMRGKADWVAPGSVVTLVQTRPDEIIVKPHAYAKKIDWEVLWSRIKKVRSFKGKGGSMSLSEFIEKDRQSH